MSRMYGGSSSGAAALLGLLSEDADSQQGDAEADALGSARSESDWGTTLQSPTPLSSRQTPVRQPDPVGMRHRAASRTGARPRAKPFTFRLDAMGSAGTVLRKVLGESAEWAEVVEPGASPGMAASAPVRLPSLAGPRAALSRRAAQEDRTPERAELTWRTGRFKPSEYSRSSTSCRVNHIPGSSAICKKDQLVRHIRKMRSCYGPIFNFVPTSFIVPSEFTKFTSHFADLQEAGEKSTWICKPAGMSRGRKIFLLSDPSALNYDRECVVQRYIPRPLLVSGYKWDIRLYVAVTSARPLRAFVYTEGLARFGTEKYDLSDIGNIFSHLTNYSLNKNSASYAENKETIGGGAKWLLTRLLTYLQDRGIDTQLLWQRIRHLAILTLLVLMPIVPEEADGCFELYQHPTPHPLRHCRLWQAQSCHSSVNEPWHC